MTGIRSTLLLALCCLPAVLTLPAYPDADAAERDLEPRPPWVFFTEPDPVTEAEIDDFVNKSFADLSKVVSARDALVRRYKLWSLKKILHEIRRGKNEPLTWNSALTVHALRSELGPAPGLWITIPALTRLLEQSAEAYRRVFAALALGSFHGQDSIRDPWSVPASEGRDQAIDRAKRDLDNGLRLLGVHLGDFDGQVRSAAALALGKWGRGARVLLEPETRMKDAVTEVRQAALLASGLLPKAGDRAFYLRMLQDVDRRIRRAAALAIALQALVDNRPAWPDPPVRLWRALRNDTMPDLEDGWEATFARGVLAHVFPALEGWDAVFEDAVSATSKSETAKAAAQCLLFCEAPWFLEQALRYVKGAGETSSHPVLAAFYLRLASRGEADGAEKARAYIDACRDLLSRRDREPKGKPDWDVRFYIAVGLLRAFAAGSLKDETLRRDAWEALEVAARKGLHPGPFRDELDRIVQNERRKMLDIEQYRIPEKRIRTLEESFDDRLNLLVYDIKDVAIARLNAMVLLVFQVNSIRPGTPGDRDKSEMPRRYLKACFDAHPYFTRLDLLENRGRRTIADPVRDAEPADTVDTR